MFSLKWNGFAFTIFPWPHLFNSLSSLKVLLLWKSAIPSRLVCFCVSVCVCARFWLGVACWLVLLLWGCEMKWGFEQLVSSETMPACLWTTSILKNEPENPTMLWLIVMYLISLSALTTCCVYLLWNSHYFMYLSVIACNHYRMVWLLWCYEVTPLVPLPDFSKLPYDSAKMLFLEQGNTCIPIFKKETSPNKLFWK